MIGIVATLAIAPLALQGFWLGSTQAEVLEAMGRAPDKINSYGSNQQWHYGQDYFSKDEIEFRNGRVWCYSNMNGRLKVRSFKMPGKTFWLRSDQDEVLAANGAPVRVFRTDYLDWQTWYYGSGYPSSEVQLRDGRVHVYSDSAGRLSLPAPDPEIPAFSIGATETEVLGAMGAPERVYKSDYIDSTTWYYKSRGYQSVTVEMENGRVREYDNPDGSLRVVLLSRKKLDPKATRIQGVDMGSSLDDVLAVMGTPSGFKWDTPVYRDARLILKFTSGRGTSKVEFGCESEGGYLRPDRVVAYDNAGGNLVITLTPNGLLVAAKFLDSKAVDVSSKVYTISSARDFEAESSRYSSYGAPSKLRSYSGAYFSLTAPPMAENGSYYGEISELTGRPKTIYVRSYFRSDGTYVRSHYRSSARGR
ncbi:MAG: hypothetical protein AKCLJLPJ_01606 [Fimbriimonadales bacterium]|nr:hypothetical protein [Fimbriimonadales bacterium]